MSSRSWLAALTQAFDRLSLCDRPLRIAVVGIGQELHGDDAAGLVLVQKLRRRLGERDGLLLIEAGPSPENVTGALRRFEPSIVILADAALMAEAPGTVDYLDPVQTDGISASSHTLPPRLVADFLSRELECTVGLLGIEPAMTDFPSPLTLTVRRSIDRAGRQLAELLTAALTS